MSNIEIPKSRLAFIYFSIVVIFCAIIVRMGFVVITGDKVRIRGIYDPQRIDKRGNIYDRNGVLVATDLKTKSLYVSSALVRDHRNIAKSLSEIFSDLSYDEVFKKISRKNKKHWILIRRNLTPSQVEQVRDLQLAGLLFEDDRIRVYPQKSISSHYVGYVDLDRKGLSGIEIEHDNQLINGEKVELAMDVRLQDILHDELLSGMEESKSVAAAGIIMDVNNGEILALSSLPGFDPNLQNVASSKQRFNRVTNGTYELGSVLKIFTNAIAFEEDLVKMSDVFSVKEPIKYGKFTIEDDHHVKDELTVEEIFADSSNIGTVKIAEKIGVKKQKEFLEKLGLLKKVDTDFPGLGKPIYPKRWREINLYTISYGHGIAITPLHLASTVSAMVNGGNLYRPSFVKLKDQPKVQKKVIKDSTSIAVKLLLRKAVTDGTGRNANVEGYEVGGKTGTAERAEFGSYNKRKTMASFIAVFPANNPKYLVYVLFDRPNVSFNTGGMVAAPIAGKIVKNIAPLLDVRPNK